MCMTFTVETVVIQKCEKDCVSNTVVTTDVGNPKYFYGEDTEVWDGALSGGVTEIMLQVFGRVEEVGGEKDTTDSVFNGEIVVGDVRQNSADDYWMDYHGLFPHF